MGSTTARRGLLSAMSGQMNVQTIADVARVLDQEQGQQKTDRAAVDVARALVDAAVVEFHRLRQLQQLTEGVMSELVQLSVCSDPSVHEPVLSTVVDLLSTAKTNHIVFVTAYRDYVRVSRRRVADIVAATTATGQDRQDTSTPAKLAGSLSPQQQQSARHNHLAALQTLNELVQQANHSSGTASLSIALLDAMDCAMERLVDLGLDSVRKDTVKDPVYSVLQKLQTSKVSALSYRAHVCEQSLLRLSSDEDPSARWLRRGISVFRMGGYLTSAVLSVDLSHLEHALEEFKQVIHTKTVRAPWLLYVQTLWRLALGAVQDTTHRSTLKHFLDKGRETEAPRVWQAAFGVVEAVTYVGLHTPSAAVHREACGVLQAVFIAEAGSYSKDARVKQQVLINLHTLMHHSRCEAVAGTQTSTGSGTDTGPAAAAIIAINEYARRRGHFSNSSSVANTFRKQVRTFEPHCALMSPAWDSSATQPQFHKLMTAALKQVAQGTDTC